MDDTNTALLLSIHATNSYYLGMVTIGSVLMAIFLAATLFGRGKTTKDRLRSFGIVGALLAIAFVTPMISSSAPVDQCSKASTNPQILKGLRGSQIQNVRRECERVGVVIGPVQS